MPHDYNWLDVQKKHEQDLLDDYEKQDRQFEALNAVIKARLNADCLELNCKGCGNIQCVQANKKYLKLWPEIEKESFPVSSVNTTNTTLSADGLKLDAQSQSSHEQKLSGPRGDRANGLSLFNFDQEEEAA